MGDALAWVLPLTLLAVFFYPMSRPTQSMWSNPIEWPVMFVLELLAILPLALRRTRPGLSAALIAVGAMGQVVLFYGPGFTMLTVPAAVYAAAKYGSRRASRGYLLLGLIGAVLLGLMFLLNAVFQINHPLSEFSDQEDVYWPTSAGMLMVFVLISAFSAAVVVTCWLLGTMAGRRRREIEAITERNQLLERERDQEARLAADAERMRIAREMHDVISHSMSVMIAQADGGRYVLSQYPEQAEKAFETIGETGRDSLAELRRMLGVLREEDEQLAKRPTPGLRDLPQLIRDVRASGLAVGLRSAEELPEVPEGIGLAAYRVVQEALTNTLKHGGPEAEAEVRVWLSGGRPVLVVEVSDDGLGSRAEGDGGGSGLRGMRERAALYGGTVENRAHDGGFDVTASFPLRSHTGQANGVQKQDAQEAG